jgi:acyl-CoA synthetase (NDP forming)
MAIDSLLRPHSIAIVGASDTVGPGYNAWKALEFVGFPGQIHLVNPKRTELFGRPCHPSLDAIPGPIDAAFVAVGAEQVLGVARSAHAKGAGGLAILSSGFGEAGAEGRARQDALVAFAGDTGLAVCGPNCLGLLNFSGRTALFGTSLPATVDHGGVAAVVQSGSVGIALLNAGRALGLSCLITSGNEAVTTTAEYIEALLDDEAVRTIVVFAEEIKRPARFIAALARARTLGKPVIVLKSGRSERGRAAVLAHTGAVAGSVEACDAALLAAGAIQVHSLDELIETTILVASGSQPARRGVGVLSLSGGEIALALDAAEAVGLHLPAADPVEADLAALLPPFATIANPLDLTWAGLYDPAVARACARTLAGHPEVGTLVLLQDAPSGLGQQQAERYSRLLDAVAAGARDVDIPLAAVSNLSGALHPLLSETATRQGVPYLRGTQEGFSALGRFATWATPQPSSPPQPTDPDVMSQAREALARLTATPTEDEARAVLSLYGVPGLAERRVATAAEAADAATALGFPVVLKGLAAGIVHKSDAGLVAVGLTSAEDVFAAADGMRSSANRLGAPMLGFLVQEKAAPVAEIFVGGRVDPDFGPLVVMGAGGILVELYRDVVIRLAPITEEQALEALNSTLIAATLRGFRGRPPADLTAAARAVAALSRFISDFRDSITEVEINPLAVFREGSGCSALDAVILGGSALSRLPIDRHQI